MGIAAVSLTTATEASFKSRQYILQKKTALVQPAVYLARGLCIVADVITLPLTSAMVECSHISVQSMNVGTKYSVRHLMLLHETPGQSEQIKVGTIF